MTSDLRISSTWCARERLLLPRGASMNARKASPLSCICMQQGLRGGTSPNGRVGPDGSQEATNDDFHYAHVISA